MKQFSLSLSPAETDFEALGIPFECIAVAEKEKIYRECITLNNPRVKDECVYDSVESLLDQVKDSTSVLHRQVNSTGVSLAVMGSPCNPYSTKRSKRFADGNVAEHSMNRTTQGSIVDLYLQFEPRVGVTEQVKGFQMRTSDQDEASPYTRPSCVFVCPTFKTNAILALCYTELNLNLVAACYHFSCIVDQIWLQRTSLKFDHSLRFIHSMSQQPWKFGGYWFVKLELDSNIWMKISRPRLDHWGSGYLM